MNFFPHFKMSIYTQENNIFDDGWKKALYQDQAEIVKQAIDKYPSVFTEEKLDEMFASAKEKSESLNAFDWVDPFTIFIREKLKPQLAAEEVKHA